MKAWLEAKDGATKEIGAACYLGRAPMNEVVIASGQVSRRHALIHAQLAEQGHDYWLADLGSTNGTVLNGRRLTVPCHLKDGDVITIGGESFAFRAEAGPTVAAASDGIAATQVVRAKQACWLLMVDIRGFTQMNMQTDTLAVGRTVGTWLRLCREAAESTGGVVDKFLGDAIFAYWPDTPAAPEQVGRSLGQLRLTQKLRRPDFRIVVHRGAVLMDGGAGGANNLSGLEVICVFRMEKIGSKLGVDTVFSAAASQALAPTWAFASLGRHALDGFPGTHELFRLAE